MADSKKTSRSWLILFLMGAFIMPIILFFHFEDISLAKHGRVSDAMITGKHTKQDDSVDHYYIRVGFKDINEDIVNTKVRLSGKDAKIRYDSINIGSFTYIVYNTKNPQIARLGSELPDPSKGAWKFGYIFSIILMVSGILQGAARPRS